ncbi:MAG: hypothetical protein Q8K99_04650 [Actinomycetota bacterium]|nr:hypothetical protein [Actinomycetota bacterium]
MKNAIIAAIVVVLVGAAFWGGTVYADLGSDNTTAGRSGLPGGSDGRMGQMTEQDRAKFQNMTDAERQQFFEEQTGSQAPIGAMGGRRGGTLEGEVLDIATDSVTIKLANGSSQTVYTTADTLMAYTEGASKLEAGASVLVFAEPETDGVTTATTIVVK